MSGYLWFVFHIPPIFGSYDLGSKYRVEGRSVSLRGKEMNNSGWSKGINFPLPDE